MNIRYGIERVRPNGKGKRDIEHENHGMELPLVDWEDNDAHQKVKAAIYEKHPGWHIHGYALADAEQQDQADFTGHGTNSELT